MGHAKTYTITEVEAASGISAFTLRYYDKCGFFPDIIRDARKKRFYSDTDIERLRLIEALRISGLSIERIGAFLKDFDEGNQDEARRVLAEQVKHCDMLRDQVDAAQEFLQEEIALLEVNAIQETESKAEELQLPDITIPLEPIRKFDIEEIPEIEEPEEPEEELEVTYVGRHARF